MIKYRSMRIFDFVVFCFFFFIDVLVRMFRFLIVCVCGISFFLVSRRETFVHVNDVVIPYRDIKLIPKSCIEKKQPKYIEKKGNDVV